MNCKTGATAYLYPGASNGDEALTDGGVSGRGDGYVADVINFQGVRTYDPNAGQWTTPDAYAGDVHDPMTQKPIMWNRNNPYEYSDPSGYDVCVGHICIPTVSIPGIVAAGRAAAAAAGSVLTAAGTTAAAGAIALLSLSGDTPNTWRKANPSEIKTWGRQGIVDPHAKGTKANGSKDDLFVDRDGNIAVGNKDGTGEKEIIGNVHDEPRSGEQRSKPKKNESQEKQ